MVNPAIQIGLTCRFCGAPLSEVFVDLGAQPLANSYLEPEDLRKAEAFLPLCVYVCGKCFLVQLPEEERPEAIFSDYAYFSSYSESWLRHAETYAAAMVKRFGLGAGHRVIEVASNDGYLLRWFAEWGIPVQGIEPAGNVAAAAEAAGIPTLVKFFGTATARELVEAGTRADLLVGNNVLAHVPDLNDFVAGLKLLLAPAGVLTMEFPHLVRLMAEDQFDTIYHEHYSYFSLSTVRRVFAAHGLSIFDVEELPTHGGSLRVFAGHMEEQKRVEQRVIELLVGEAADGFSQLETYRSFGERVRRVKRGFLRFLIQAKEEGKSIAGYGAPAKGNTLLNYCGVRTDFLDFTVDRSPHKQGRFLPGSRVPIHGPDRLRETRPDYVLILPWNLKEEIMEQMADVRSWGGRFVVAIPEVKILA
jgi:SAM-dependent methyltransferase